MYKRLIEGTNCLDALNGLVDGVVDGHAGGVGLDSLTSIYRIEK